MNAQPHVNSFGNVSSRPAPGTMVQTHGGARVQVGAAGGFVANGHREVMLHNGGAVQMRPNGHIAAVHDARRGMDIHHGLNGSRRVMVERPGNVRIYAERGRPGFIQRPYSYHGHEFARRTYYWHGRAYDRYYRPYSYRGVIIHVYTPVRYYPMGFYGWAYNPWAHPVVYAWGWGGAPWYGYYGGYFTPYATYPDASYWLADYVVAQQLQAEYQANQEAQLAQQPIIADGSVAMTPDVKTAISTEVRNQLALEYNEAKQNGQGQEIDPASSGIARLMADGQSHVFVVGSALTVVDGSGSECDLTSGDVLSLSPGGPQDAQAADLVVLASKGGQECQKAATVTVQVADLQEMHNQMRATLDQGMEELQSKAGKGGLPAAPPSAAAAPTPTEFAQAAPPPNPADASDINQQLSDADAAEREASTQAQQEAGVAPAIAAPPPVTTSISMGQSIAQVKGAMGEPTHVVNLGPKTILQYPDMKIIFKDGKVVDVQ